MSFYCGQSLFGVSAKHNPYQPDHGFPTASAETPNVPQGGMYTPGGFAYTSKPYIAEKSGSDAG